MAHKSNPYKKAPGDPRYDRRSQTFSALSKIGAVVSLYGERCKDSLWFVEGTRSDASADLVGRGMFGATCGAIYGM